MTTSDKPSAKSASTEQATTSPYLENGSNDTSTPAGLTSACASSRPDASNSQPTSAPRQRLEIRNLPLDQIHIDDDKNGRLSIDGEHVRSLANQIAQDGLLHPITVRRINNRYRLVAGNNRYLAARRLGWTEIAANIVTVTDRTAAKLRLAENVSRSNLSPIEEAVQINDLVQLHPDGVDGVAVELARSAAWILDRLELLAWPPEIQHAVHAAHLTLASAKWIARIQPESRRKQMLHEATVNGINSRTARMWYNQTLTYEPAEPDTTKSSDPDQQNTTRTLTTIECQLCANRIDLLTTHTLRLCNPCMDAVGNAAGTLQTQPNALPEPTQQQYTPPPQRDPTTSPQQPPAAAETTQP